MSRTTSGTRPRRRAASSITKTTYIDAIEIESEDSENDEGLDVEQEEKEEAEKENDKEEIEVVVDDDDDDYEDFEEEKEDENDVIPPRAFGGKDIPSAKSKKSRVKATPTNSVKKRKTTLASALSPTVSSSSSSSSSPPSNPSSSCNSNKKVLKKPPVTKKKSLYPSSPQKKKTKEDVSKLKKNNNDHQDITSQSKIDIVIPQSLLSAHAGSAGGECMVLVQVDPMDATVLDFEGASGAIGRFETNNDGVTLDLKGYQYTGTIHPGPTAMVVSLGGKTGQLKVESITDEFVTLSKAHDTLAKLDAVVEGNMDGSYDVVDEDVNARERGGGGKSKGGRNGEEQSGDEDEDKVGRKNANAGKKKNTTRKQQRSEENVTDDVGTPATSAIKKRKTGSGRRKK